MSCMCWCCLCNPYPEASAQAYSNLCQTIDILLSRNCKLKDRKCKKNTDVFAYFRSLHRWLRRAASIYLEDPGRSSEVNQSWRKPGSMYKRQGLSISMRKFISLCVSVNDSTTSGRCQGKWRREGQFGWHHVRMLFCIRTQVFWLSCLFVRMNQAKQTCASWQRRGWCIRFVLAFHFFKK